MPIIPSAGHASRRAPADGRPPARRQSPTMKRVLTALVAGGLAVAGVLLLDSPLVFWVVFALHVGCAFEYTALGAASPARVSARPAPGHRAAGGADLAPPRVELATAHALHAARLAPLVFAIVLLAAPYMPVLIRPRGWYYGVGMPGIVYRSRDGLTAFEEAPTRSARSPRTCATAPSPGSLHTFFVFFYTLRGTAPNGSWSPGWTCTTPGPTGAPRNPRRYCSRSAPTKGRTSRCCRPAVVPIDVPARGAT